MYLLLSLFLSVLHQGKQECGHFHAKVLRLCLSPGVYTRSLFTDHPNGWLLLHRAELQQGLHKPAYNQDASFWSSLPKLGSVSYTYFLICSLTSWFLCKYTYN